MKPVVRLKTDFRLDQMFLSLVIGTTGKKKVKSSLKIQFQSKTGQQTNLDTDLLSSSDLNLSL